MGFDFDCVVVGGGIVGLAVARELGHCGLQTVVLEAEAQPLTHTSSRNSEVIHAGIYYEPGSVKARLCVEGRQMLYDYCQARRVDFQRIGKLIVAVDESEVQTLESYRRRAIENGVDNLEWRSREEVGEMEPAIVCARALWSPSTGILDTHEFAMALLADVEAADGMLVCASRVASARRAAGGWRLTLGDGETVTARRLVNSAGLGAVALAGNIEGLAEQHVPNAYFAIGHYYALMGRSPFNHLVYPTAGGGGLGVHVTLDTGGQVRFGPDVTWINDIDYRFDDSRRADFVAAIRRYYPDLDDQRLVPGYTGIRPKIAGPGEPAADFIVQGPKTHGLEGLVNLFGIESPGITASLAIARCVAETLQLAATDKQQYIPEEGSLS